MKLHSSTERYLNPTLRQIYYCPGCSTLRLPRKRFSGTEFVSSARCASTVSTTAINATKTIPKRYKAIYDALLDVRKDAAAHTNLSRLQLALQSLETENSTFRLGVLGLYVQNTARRLARLLLADALENEGTWEKQLFKEDGAQGILIRYGEAPNTSFPQRTSVPVLYLKSTTLERLNIEILISAVNGPGKNGSSTPVDTFLSPAVGTPTDVSGRQVTINQPVHQTLVVTNGLDELVTAIALLAQTNFDSSEDRDAISLAVNLPKSNLNSTGHPFVLDMGKAERGLQAIRESTANASTYGQDWTQAGIVAVSDWMSILSTQSQSTNERPLAPLIRDLITALLISARASIEMSDQLYVQKANSLGLSGPSNVSLKAVIDEFSRSAHQELQSGLASAWSSRNWRKLAWFKLFWRVDDVGLIVTDLVTNAWLPKTERSVYELSGRLSQVGINPVMQEMWKPQQEAYVVEETLTAPVLESSALLASSGSDTVRTQPVIQNQAGVPTVKLEPIPRPVPVAATISNVRNQYIYNSTTSLTSTAQQLVLRTFSISGLSAGLSGLAYMSTLSANLYEAGTIFAVGTVFALWRMQSGWLTATKSFEDGMFEEGRTVISSIVARMRSLVDLKASTPVDPVEKEAIDKARAAVEKARAELDALKSAEPRPTDAL